MGMLPLELLSWFCAQLGARGHLRVSLLLNRAWRSWRSSVSAAWERSRMSPVSGRVAYL